MHYCSTNSVEQVLNALRLHRGQLTEIEAARLVGISPSWFRHDFKRQTRISFREARLHAKLAHVAELLKSTALTINEISGLLGYSDRTKFEKIFKKFNGLTPTVYRRV
jgi:AraC-like DNA-binding protein